MSDAPRRMVYVIGGDALSAAGRGTAALARACLGQPPEPVRRRLQSQAGTIELPYFRMPIERTRLPEAIESVAAQALSQGELGETRRARVGLFVGTSASVMALHEQMLADAGDELREVPLAHPDQSQLAARLQATLGLNGPHYTFSTACSSAANAVLYASWMVREGLLDDALVVGVEFESRLSLQGFASLLLTARDVARPFDAARDGIVLGECVAALLLSALPRDPSSDWRVLGGGTLCDTSHPTGASAARIAETLRLALTDAQLAPAEVAAIKAHGTGTRGNDLAEVQALRQVFGAQPPPFTSLKPVLGHTLGACGALETLACMACLDQGRVPASANFATTDPEIGLAPLRAPQAPAAGALLLDYFAFGGNNCVLALAGGLHGSA